MQSHLKMTLQLDVDFSHPKGFSLSGYFKGILYSVLKMYQYYILACSVLATAANFLKSFSVKMS